MGRVRVLISDWQVLFREGIHFILSGEEDIDVVGEATSSEEALSLIEKNPPTVAILNADHSQIHGVELTRFLWRNLPSLPVILIVDNDDEELLFSVVKSGASACLTKKVGPDELVKTIREVTQGNRPISEMLLKPAVAATVLKEFDELSLMDQPLSNLLARLLPNEVEILQRIAGQNSGQNVSRALNINEETLRHTLVFILNKLVANAYNRELIEAAQASLPSIIYQIANDSNKSKPPGDYITKSEFLDKFKETLKERLKAFLGELNSI